MKSTIAGRRAQAKLASGGRLTRRTGLLVLLSTSVLTACGLPPRRPDTNTDTIGAYWQGKLSVRTGTPTPQSLAAEFELTGSAEKGQLLLLSPLGTSLARMSWTATSAVLERPAQPDERFANLDALARAATGVDIPIRQLFDWLAARPSPAAGWEVDLGNMDAGRLYARHAGTSAELRITLSR